MGPNPTPQGDPIPIETVPPRLRESVSRLLQLWDEAPDAVLGIVPGVALPFMRRHNLNPLEAINAGISAGLIRRLDAGLSLTDLGKAGLGEAMDSHDGSPRVPESLAVIRKAMAGEMKAGLVGGGSLPSDGIATVRIGDWRIRAFMDAGCLDYLHEVVDPQGLVRGYAEVGKDLASLGPTELRAVSGWLERVEPWC